MFLRRSATNFQSASASYRRHYCRKSSLTAMASGVACSLNSTLHKQPRRLQQPGSLGWSVSAAVRVLQLHSLVDRSCELNSLPCRSWDYLSCKGLGQESTHKGGNQRSKYVKQAQQERPQSLPVTLTWHACQYKVHKLHQRGTSSSWLGQELLPAPKGKRASRVSEIRSCANREVDLGSHSLSHPFFDPSLISHTVSVDIKHDERRRRREG